jgi:hypothetical protein
MDALIWMMFVRKRKRPAGSDHQALAAEHRVDAVFWLELVVGADFDNFAAVEYVDPVGVTDRWKSVRDDKAGAFGHEFLQCLLDQLLGFGVDSDGGLVFAWWMAGGGVKAGTTCGETDEYGWNLTENLIHVHEMQATSLHLAGINHTKLTYRYQGRQFRLTDVHGHVQYGIFV